MCVFVLWVHIDFPKTFIQNVIYANMQAINAYITQNYKGKHFCVWCDCCGLVRVYLYGWSMQNHPCEMISTRWSIVDDPCWMIYDGSSARSSMGDHLSRDDFNGWQMQFCNLLSFVVFKNIFFLLCATLLRFCARCAKRVLIHISTSK